MGDEARVTTDTDSLNARYVVIDVETTGLRVMEGHEICEVAAVPVVAGRIGEPFETLVNPGRPIPADASAVNGITDEMVARAPSLAEVIPGLLDFVGEHSVVVIHNAPFDMSFLQSALIRIGRPPLSNLVIDTLELARREFGLGGNSLGRLARRLSLARGTAHRARGDTETTARLLLYFVNRLRERGLPTVGDLGARTGGYYERFAVRATP